MVQPKKFSAEFFGTKNLSVENSFSRKMLLPKLCSAENFLDRQKCPPKKCRPQMLLTKKNSGVICFRIFGQKVLRPKSFPPKFWYQFVFSKCCFRRWTMKCWGSSETQFSKVWGRTQQSSGENGRSKFRKILFDVENEMFGIVRNASWRQSEPSFKGKRPFEVSMGGSFQFRGVS